MEFPQFRKYSNNKSYFKILSQTQWEELQIVGKKVLVHQMEVKILPDRNFMMDMMSNEGNRWVIIDEKEYEDLKERAFK